MIDNHQIHRRGAENAEGAQRKTINSLRYLCFPQASAVSAFGVPMSWVSI